MAGCRKLRRYSIPGNKASPWVSPSIKQMSTKPGGVFAGLLSRRESIGTQHSTAREMDSNRTWTTLPFGKSKTPLSDVFHIKGGVFQHAHGEIVRQILIAGKTKIYM
jgi:hypothetical protein